MSRRRRRTKPADTGKLQIILDDETRPIWESAKRAAAEVAAWPAWKHTEQPVKLPDLTSCDFTVAGCTDSDCPRCYPSPDPRLAEERQWRETWADVTPEPRR